MVSVHATCTGVVVILLGDGIFDSRLPSSWPTTMPAEHQGIVSVVSAPLASVHNSFALAWEPERHIVEPLGNISGSARKITRAIVEHRRRSLPAAETGPPQGSQPRHRSCLASTSFNLGSGIPATPGRGSGFPVPPEGA